MGNYVPSKMLKLFRANLTTKGGNSHGNNNAKIFLLLFGDMNVERMFEWG